MCCGGGCLLFKTQPIIIVICKNFCVEMTINWINRPSIWKTSICKPRPSKLPKEKQCLDRYKTCVLVKKTSPSGMRLASPVHGVYCSRLKYASGSFSVPGIAVLTFVEFSLGLQSESCSHCSRGRRHGRMHLVMDEVRPKDVPSPKVKCDTIRSKRVPKMADGWGRGKQRKLRKALWSFKVEKSSLNFHNTL